MEGAGQQPRDIVVGPRVVQVEVQPEELPSGQGLLDVLPGGVGVLADLLMMPFIVTALLCS